MAQGKYPRSPLAFASVLYPGRCLAAELANPEPTGSSQQGTPRGLRTIAKLFRPGAPRRWGVTMAKVTQPAAVGNPFVRRTCGSFAARGE